MDPTQNHDTSDASTSEPQAATQSSLLKSGDAVNFEQIWPKIEPLVNRMFSIHSFASFNKSEWHDIFWNVHLLCIWNSESAIKLQEKLVDVFDDYITQEADYIMSNAQNDMSLLKAYIQAWKRFMFYYKYVPLPFAPIETFFKLSATKLLSKKPREVESYIRLTMTELWALKIFTEVISRLISGAMLLIEQERNGIVCDPYLIVGVKESCLYLSCFLQDQWFIYRNNYEKVYISQTENFYRAMGQQYYCQHGALLYMKWADAKIKEEQDRANWYLEPHSYWKVIFVVVHTLIDWYKDILSAKFISLIKSNDIASLKIMFTLLDLVEGGIEPLLYKFEDYFTNFGIENLKMEALSFVNDSGKYIELLLKLYNSSTKVVTEAFGDDARFLTARDIAFTALINDKSVFQFAIEHKQKLATRTSMPSESETTSSVAVLSAVDVTVAQMAAISLNDDPHHNGGLAKPTSNGNVAGTVASDESASDKNTKLVESKSAELLANYCDMLLRKTTLSRHLTSDQIEEKLMNVIIMLKYVEDKDKFMKYYKAHLTRRLILSVSADNDKEEIMANWLREVGMPAEFVNKFSRMFQDLQVSRDFNRAFRVWAMIPAGDELVSVKILNSSAWMGTLEKINVSLPLEIEDELHRIEDYYKESHTGRNLQWQHQFSSGVITYNSDNGSYDLDATSYQVSILFCWNDRPNDSISLESLSLSTQLSNVELKRTLWSLMSYPKLKSQVLLSETPVKSIKELKDSTVFKLNTQFALQTKNGRVQKRGRVNLIGRLQLQTDKSREEEAESILKLRTLRTQEAVMKILKTRKSITNSSLHCELTNVLKQMFIPSQELIMEQLEWLIGHSYIRRDPLDANKLNYNL